MRRKHAFEGIELPYIGNSWWYHGPRLAFQPVIVRSALYSARVIDWPRRRDDQQSLQTGWPDGNKPYGTCAFSYKLPHRSCVGAICAPHFNGEPP
jgi:hypothetical protein